MKNNLYYLSQQQKNNNITKEFSSFARSLKDFKNATKTKNEPNMTIVNPRNL